MIPYIGQKVYTIYKEGLDRTHVKFIGKNSFLVEDYDSIIQEASEYKFEDYNKTWFSSLALAKQKLREKFNCEEIVQIDDGYWEAKI